jgi:hypothetical protein
LTRQSPPAPTSIGAVVGQFTMSTVPVLVPVPVDVPGVDVYWQLFVAIVSAPGLAGQVSALTLLL